MRSVIKPYLVAVLVFLVSVDAMSSSTRIERFDSWKSQDTTKTWTPPSATDTLVGRASTDTLTNKSISGASNTFTSIPASTALTGQVPVANGGTNQSSYTNGQLLIGNTTGNTLTKATLTAGPGITITNGTGSISVAETQPTDGWVAWTPTFTGFGTVTGISFYSKREGDSLRIRGTFTSGSSTATEARITLGYNGVDASVTSSSNLPTTSFAGVGIYNSASANFPIILMEPAKTYFTFGIQGASNAGLTKVNGNDLTGSGTKISFQALIPINDWGG